MEEFWKGIDTPAKKSTERGLKKWPELTTLLNDQDQRHGFIKKDSKAADEDIPSNNLKLEFLEIPLSEISDATRNFNKEYCGIGSGGHIRIHGSRILE
ncbi:hypothetical protein QVD17_37436 [Tagetes erecta]|uniref:Uncharacterized protein n=1 Tax=Tagetes erecta TaxID=13708 RepID=A0AAD8JWF5_TARER|nr:hypothetical protein QVD17_37436 [Tagetes erecta]